MTGGVSLEYVIEGINGPVVTVRGKTGLSVMEMVYVGAQRLIGEVISVEETQAIVQVYEETAGLKAGEAVVPTGSQMSVTLGPGMIGAIYDGIQRPLDAIRESSGTFIARGESAPALNPERYFDVTVQVHTGDLVRGGMVFAVCRETPVVEHRCLIPPELQGEVVEAVSSGSYCVKDTILKVKTSDGTVHSLGLSHQWPIRRPRPAAERLPGDRPLVTGQRIIDTMFPVAKGGAAAIPGGFGTGKTMTQHQLAKWCDADLIIYVGCGERGNEMTEVLHEFSDLQDPRTGRPLLERTILLANTSNMPVAAREASIYTGITMAEYYRDMGYHVAIMADSTSRWAEALREISGRLEEMPADEGFPAYLPSRLSAFYERAGRMKALCGAEGSVTIIGAVSPQGSDFSEPVTQNTKRFTRCFWALDKSLAYARHYPAINWNDSYSEYLEELSGWYAGQMDDTFLEMRGEFQRILSEENSLMEIVKLIGADVLPDDQKLLLEIARVIRVGFLQQNAFHPQDTYVPLEKQWKMMGVILDLYEKCRQIIARQVPISRIVETGVFDRVVQIKYDVPNDRLDQLDTYGRVLEEMLGDLYES
ncbi:MAG: V-type ATP synthase subunit A [Clostridiales bacterium]|nr:V-type ATP synthase subunit A [Clostridiales bacterium]